MSSLCAHCPKESLSWLIDANSLIVQLAQTYALNLVEVKNA